jgi:hypothetical protein
VIAQRWQATAKQPCEPRTAISAAPDAPDGLEQKRRSATRLKHRLRCCRARGARDMVPPPAACRRLVPASEGKKGCRRSRWRSSWALHGGARPMCTSTWVLRLTAAAGFTASPIKPSRSDFETKCAQGQHQQEGTGPGSCSCSCSWPPVSLLLWHGGARPAPRTRCMTARGGPRGGDTAGCTLAAPMGAGPRCEGVRSRGLHKRCPAPARARRWGRGARRAS